MINETDVRPSAEHTEIDLHPEIQTAGVESINEPERIDELHRAAQEVGGSITHEAVPPRHVRGDLDYKQFENPEPLPVDEASRWKKIFTIRKQAMEGTKNAA